jgi:hypothetical protein
MFTIWKKLQNPHRHVTYVNWQTTVHVSLVNETADKLDLSLQGYLNVLWQLSPSVFDKLLS